MRHESTLTRVQDRAKISARRLAASAQDVAGRAAGFAGQASASMKARVAEASERSEGFGQQILRPLQFWAADVERFVRDRPFEAVAVAVGLGYVFGKLIGGRRKLPTRS